MELQFTKEELIKAIKQIDNNPELTHGRKSSTYDLIFDGNKYPPILVLSIANKSKNDKDLTLADFNNSTEIPFQILRKNGFEIKLKTIENNKNKFKRWLLKHLAKKSGAGPAYITSLDWLSNRFYEEGKISNKSIFDIEDIQLITDLHSEVKKIQKDKTSYIFNKDAPSYGAKHFYSASLNKYKEFLLLKNKNYLLDQTTMIHNVTGEPFDIKTFSEHVLKCGLVYSNHLITRYIASLATKPFVLLSGLSGSGKTKLAQAFAQWISEDSSQYCIVPVGADWTNREPLLGYVNALDNSEYVKPENGALQLILEANKNEHKPYFLILDEMNLSHVERYFADFLSIMESKDIIKLHSSEDEKNDVPSKIDWPSNLFIVGTVNIDETTYMFSPKVLDRANVIEFRVNKDDIQNFLKSPKDMDFTELNGKGASMGEDFLKIASNKEFPTIDTEKLNQKLIQFFEELKKTGAEFGYRSATEIHRLYNQLSTLDNEMLENDKIDIAIMQKLLPKLHGSRRKLQPILEILASFCVTESIDVSKAFLNNKESINYKDNSDILYPLSLEKITRMYKGAIDNGFASYAEA